jgi:hypothetical protein
MAEARNVQRNFDVKIHGGDVRITSKGILE